jgi:nicotinate-nucleotide adenylyltransferase
MNKRIGIMGGTFDPIHNAHLALAECALVQLPLDEVWFMPAGNPYFKKDRHVTDGEDRCRMTELAIAGEPRFRLSRLEQERDGETYTAETLKYLHMQYPQDHFYFLTGSDSLYQIESWYQPETILKLATLVTAEREYPDRPRSLRAEASYLAAKYNGDVRILSLREIDISSTMIREMVHRGKDISQLVPPRVNQYIKEHKLYRNNG